MRLFNRAATIVPLILWVLTTACALPDLTVDLWFEPANPGLGEQITARLRVRNIGDSPTTTLSYVWFYRHTPTLPAPSDPSTSGWTIGTLPAGGVANMSYSFTPASPGVYSGYAWVDREGYIAESNEANNIAGPVSYQVGGPVITSQPADMTKSPGESATFCVTASGSDLTYQWRKGEVNIPGATSGCYSIAACTESDSGTYDCVVSDGASAVISRTTTLFVGPALSIRGAKLLRDNDRVVIKSAQVVRCGLDTFAAIEDDRVLGLLVQPRQTPPSHGSRADIGGVMATNANGERYLDAWVTVQTGVGDPKPIGMIAAALGGSHWNWDPATGRGQQGATGIPGLNNVGMFVRIWGTVTYCQGTVMYVDDGSGARDNSTYRGVRVELPVPSPIEPGWLDKHVRVDGVSSCFRAGDNVHRMIRATEVRCLE